MNDDEKYQKSEKKYDILYSFDRSNILLIDFFRRPR